MAADKFKVPTGVLISPTHDEQLEVRVLGQGVAESVFLIVYIDEFTKIYAPGTGQRNVDWARKLAHKLLGAAAEIERILGPEERDDEKLVGNTHD